MKKSKLLIIISICLFNICVKAQDELPTIVSHEVMVTNKNGTICYNNGEKTDLTIPYGTTLSVYYDIVGSYIYVSNDKYSCSVKYVDVSSKTQEFNLTNEGVKEITPTKAIILVKGGLNLRKGPSVTFSKKITVPQYTVVTLTHQAGTYWYYTEYNGVYGWVTSMNNYIGVEDNKVLYFYEDVNIYNQSNNIIGKIPSNTEITNYLIVSGRYYVIYNGIKGYVNNMLYKTDGVGKIKLIKDLEITDENQKPLRRITANQELEYNMQKENNSFYFPEKGVYVHLDNDSFEYIKKVPLKIKKSGYLQEGLFGEEKQTIEENKEEIIEENNELQEGVVDESHSNLRDVIIIILLSLIFMALTILVIIKLVSVKKMSNEQQK